MTRRSTVLTAALAVLVAAVSFAATTGPFGGGAASTTVYGCFNGAGRLEASTVGLTPQPCAHRSDTIQTWTVTQYIPPGTTTTSSGSTTSSSAATTTTASPTTVAVTSTTVGGTTTTGAPAGIWKPSSAHSISWNWVLSNVPSPSSKTQVIDEDAFDAPASNVAAFGALGVKTIGYFSAGTIEAGRPDDNLIPTADICGTVSGYPDEHWLNVGDLAGLKPMINERLQMIANKGFVAAEPDNTDGAFNPTGCSITPAQQLAFDTYIASEAHSLGLAVAMKNNADQAAQLEPSFDFAIVEQCEQYQECPSYGAFTTAGKAIFEAEYNASDLNCTAAAAGHRNAVLFDLDLDGKTFTPCAPW